MGALTLENIPDAIAACLPPSPEVERPAQGMTSDVVIASGGGQSVVIKRCTNPIYLPWIRNEQRNLRLLSDSGLPIPQTICYTETLGEAGIEGWLATTRLPGRSLWKVILEMQSPERAPLLHDLGKLLRRLHSTPVPVALQNQPSWIARKLEEAQENLAWCDGTAELLEELRSTQPAALPEVLIHGDTALDNVLIDDAGNLSLIDWATADSGDARCDIALALQTEPETTFVEEEVRAFYMGYAGPREDRVTRKWFEDLWDFF